MNKRIKSEARKIRKIMQRPIPEHIIYCLYNVCGYHVVVFGYEEADTLIKTIPVPENFQKRKSFIYNGEQKLVFISNKIPYSYAHIILLKFLGHILLSHVPDDIGFFLPNSEQSTEAMSFVKLIIDKDKKDETLFNIVYTFIFSVFPKIFYCAIIIFLLSMLIHACKRTPAPKESHKEDLTTETSNEYEKHPINNEYYEEYSENNINYEDTATDEYTAGVSAAADAAYDYILDTYGINDDGIIAYCQDKALYTQHDAEANCDSYEDYYDGLCTVSYAAYGYLYEIYGIDDDSIIDYCQLQ